MFRNSLKPLTFFLLSILLFASIQPKSLLTARQSSDAKSNEVYKVLVQYKNGKGEISKFNFKNMVLTDLQVVFFQSNKSDTNTKDDFIDTKKYLYTLRYDQIQLPCTNKLVVCTYEEIQREYSGKYTTMQIKGKDGKVINKSRFEISEDLKINLSSDDYNKKCLILTHGPINMDDSLIICDLTASNIIDIQTEISKKVRGVSTRNSEFLSEYSIKKDSSGGKTNEGLIYGKVLLEGDRIKIVDPKDSSSTLTELEYNKFGTNSYSISGKDAPSSDKSCCLMVPFKENADQGMNVCANFDPNDPINKSQLDPESCKWLIDFYSSKITQKLLDNSVKNSLKVLEKSKDPSVSSEVINPIAETVRQKYLEDQYDYLNKATSDNTLDKRDIRKDFKVMLKKRVEEVCENIDACERAVKFLIKNNYLNLCPNDSKFAHDPQNPYMDLVKRNYKIDKVAEGTPGADILKDMALLKGTNNLFAEEVKILGDVPDRSSVHDAIKTLQKMKNEAPFNFKEKGEINQCAKSENLDENIKIAIIPFMNSEDEFFFNFLKEIPGILDK